MLTLELTTFLTVSERSGGPLLPRFFVSTGSFFSSYVRISLSIYTLSFIYRFEYEVVYPNSAIKKNYVVIQPAYSWNEGQRSQLLTVNHETKSFEVKK